MAETNKAGSGDEGCAEFARCWAALPDKGMFFGLLAAWVALFQFLGNSTFGYIDTASLFGWLFNAYNSKGSDDGHGNLIPFAVLVLFWWKREELLRVPKRMWWPGLVGLAVAVGIHVVGYLVQQPRVSVVALLLGGYALMGLVWGREWLAASAFPFVLLVFCVPIGSLAEGITFPLRILVARAAVGIGHGLLGMDVVREGSQIFSSQHGFNYDVAPACSGIRSLISLLVLTVIYGFVALGSGWKRGLLVVACVPLAIAGNILRLLIVIIVADAWGQAAGARIETYLGFLTFAVAGAGLLGIGYLVRDRPPSPVERTGTLEVA